MNVKEIVKNWLVEHGYDGLVDPYDGCGCQLLDLIPCCDGIENCEPAYKVEVQDDPDGYDFRMSREKPEEK